MRVAALYDIHANLPALEAVLEEVHHARVDHVVVGGDVLPGPMPCETLERLLDLDVPVQFLVGNGDREVLAVMRGQETSVPEPFKETIRWNAQEALPFKEQIASWPPTLRVRIEGLGEVVFCHATPRNDTEIFTRLTADDRLVPIFAPLNVPLVVCGHTHMQFDRTIGTTRVVNAGSVGMPFQGPGAYWLLLGPGVELRQTLYNLATAADRIRDTKYPQAAEFAANNVLQPPTEAAMVAAFSQYELK